MNYLKMLDKLGIEEFKRNYDKNEYARILNDMSIGDDLKKSYNDIRLEYLKEHPQYNDEEQYEVKVNDNSISILKIVSKDDMATTYENVETIYNHILDELPYQYVMGSKVGKRFANDFIKVLEKKYL